MRLANILHALDLKARIAIVTLALFVGTIWLLAHDLNEEVRDNFKDVLAAQQLQTTDQVASSLDEAVKLRINALADAASLIELGWMKDQSQLHIFLSKQVPLYRFFNRGIFVISREGIGLADLPTLDGREGTSYMESDFFRKVIATGEPLASKPFMDKLTHKPIINIAAPIKNSRNEIIGVLVGGNEVTGSVLLSEALPKDQHMNGEIHVISPADGVFVASTDPARIMQPIGADKMYSHDMLDQEGSALTTDSLGAKHLNSAKQVPSTGWFVVATLPASVAFKPIIELESEIYQDAALSSVAIALLLWLFLYRQLRPLSRSAQVIDAMASGREPLRPLHLEGSKEIRRLLHSFNRLQRHIARQSDSLRENAEQMQLAASVFEGTSEAILISSPDNHIISVNRAFCNMTGYDRSELIGGNPRLLRSGRHDQAFYLEMWSSIKNTGQWQGEIWNRRKNGEVYPERLIISTLYDEEGKVLQHIAIAADITKQKKAEAVIWQQANHDLLTNLPNRRLLQERVRQLLEKSRRDGLQLAVLHVDLDHFSKVNDTLGHDIGDQIIIESGKRISSCTQGPTDMVAHLGMDEFVIVLDSLSKTSPRVEQVAEEILVKLAEPFLLGDEVAHISGSIGIALFPGDAEDVVDLLMDANQAKQVAKAEGRNRYLHFTASMQLATQTRMQLANDMRGALAANQFEVYYQPIVDLSTGIIVKAEALLRWHHPERGMVSPVQFIPIAEETGLISEIGDWVFREAAQIAKHWCNRCEFLMNGSCSRPGLTDGGSGSCLYQVTVNKSPRQFFTGNTDKTWIDYLRENDIYPSCVTIEITEGLLLDQHPEVMEKFSVFRYAGIQVALDDFGTGYSAMSYLKKFDIDYIKIDRSFVRDITTDPSDRAIAETIIVMAHKLGLKVVAEGIETTEQRGLLVAAGCDYGQGYLFAKPMPSTQFKDMIDSGSICPLAFDPI